MRRLLSIASIAAALLLGAPAHAASVSAAADDPRDGQTTAARDLQQVRTTFDPGAGRWTVTVRLWTAANEKEWSMINATLWTPGETFRDGPCSGRVTSIASMRASTTPSSATVGASAGASGEPNPWGGTGPSPMQSATKSVSDGEVTLTGQDPRLVGRTGSCVTLSLTYQNQLQDSIAGGIRFPASAPAATEPRPQPLPTPPVGTTTPAPFAPHSLRLVSPTLHAGRDAKVTVRLRALDAAITGTARIRAAKGGAVLASGSWSARANRPVIARLKLSRAGRRTVRRNRSTRARLVIYARPARAVVNRTFLVRLLAARR